MSPKIYSDSDTIEFELPLGIEAPIKPPVPVQSSFQFSAFSDRGKVRTVNEDAYVIYRLSRSWDRIETNLGKDLPEQYEEHSHVMAVADGMGGVEGGRIASHLAIRLAVNLVLNSPKWALRMDNPETRQNEINEATQRAEQYFKRIDEALATHMQANPHLYGMGTTLTATLIVGRDLFTLHTGDSRAYLFRENTLYRLTRDQTVVQALVDAGSLAPDMVSKHWLRHKLSSCLGGTSREVNLEIGHVQLFDGDRILVCTDGLTEMVPDTKIAELLALDVDATTMCRQLAQTALDAGGKDNVTVLVAHSSVTP